MITKDHEMLRKWLRDYITSKDAFLKSITSINETAGGFHVVHTDKEIIYMLSPSLDETTIDAALQNPLPVVLVVYNTKDNLQQVLQAWQKLKQKQQLTILFANPQSSLETKWVIQPYIHDRITESAALKKGMQALFATVEPYR